MNTRFPYGSIDFDSYLARYFQREDAITSLPTEAELKEIARKAIVKEQMVLTLQPAGTAAQRGDTLTLSTVSTLPKFNKPRVAVSIGRGLYDKGIEDAVVGLKAGEKCEVTVKEQRVEVTVLEIKRKSVPQPADEMVAALEAKDFQGKPIKTVAEYEAFIAEEKITSALANVNYYVMEEILKDYPIETYDEEDIRILGELEREMFLKLFREERGVDLNQMSREEMQEMWHCDSLDDFVKMRYDWYKMKIQQCLIYGNILGIPLEGDHDPTARYEVLSDLTERMYEKIKEKLNGREE